MKRLAAVLLIAGLFMMGCKTETPKTGAKTDAKTGAAAKTDDKTNK